MVSELPEGKEANRKSQDLHLCGHSKVTVVESTPRSGTPLFLYIVAILLPLKSCSCPLMST